MSEFSISNGDRITDNVVKSTEGFASILTKTGPSYLTRRQNLLTDEIRNQFFQESKVSQMFSSPCRQIQLYLIQFSSVHKTKRFNKNFFNESDTLD